MSLSYGLIESIDLRHPRLPAELEGLRIAHFSDPHLPVAARHTARALRQLARIRVDLIALTGDYMDRHRPPDAAREMLEQLAADFRPRLGIVGVFGNHDRPPLMDDPPAADTIRWLRETVHDVPGLPLRLAGLGERGYDPPDPAKLALQLGKAKLAFAHDISTPPVTATQSPNHQTAKSPNHPFSLFLLHRPVHILHAAAMHADLALAGHSHGGQLRTPWGQSIHNSSDLPLDRTAGLMRYRDTLMAVTRGLGRSRLTFRLFCPPHLPVYTLRRGHLPRTEREDVVCFEPW